MCISSRYPCCDDNDLCTVQSPLQLFDLEYITSIEGKEGKEGPLKFDVVI